MLTTASSRSGTFSAKTENSELSVNISTSCEQMYHVDIEKDPRFEELSSRRWSQYILEVSGSLSEKSYGLWKKGAIELVSE